MKTWVTAFLTPVFLMIFLNGCAGVAKDTMVKCQKCGAAFAVSEGMENYRKATEGSETRVK